MLHGNNLFHRTVVYEYRIINYLRIFFIYLFFVVLVLSLIINKLMVFLHISFPETFFCLTVLVRFF